MLGMCSSCRQISGGAWILCGCVCNTSYFLMFGLRLWFVNQGSWCLLSWQLRRQLICAKPVRGVSERHFPSAVNIDSLNKNRLREETCRSLLQNKLINKKKSCLVTDVRLMKQEGHLGPSYPVPSIDPSPSPPPSVTVATSSFPLSHSTQAVCSDHSGRTAP